MNIKIHSSELNRMMKTITQCIDPKSQTLANIEIGFFNNQLYIHASNGFCTSTMRTPYLGETGESFCVDGQMFARVCSICAGEITIATDEKSCTVKGAGRTKLPIVHAKIPKNPDVIGKYVTVNAGDFTRCFNSVAYAVSTEQTRVQLTGILTEVKDGIMKMTAIDGFQMSVESIGCSGDDMKVIIPASFVKMISQATDSGETIKLYAEEYKFAVESNTMIASCSLLSGDFPDAEKLLPSEFKTECMVNAEALRNALKSGSVVNNKQNLVKLEIGNDNIRIKNNSEEAEFEADVPCDIHGDGLKIAFNLKYLLNTINAIDAENAILHLNTSVAPCIVKGQNQDGVRLVLPVRVRG